MFLTDAVSDASPMEVCNVTIQPIRPPYPLCQYGCENLPGIRAQDGKNQAAMQVHTCGAMIGYVLFRTLGVPTHHICALSLFERGCAPYLRQPWGGPHESDGIGAILSESSVVFPMVTKQSIGDHLLSVLRAVDCFESPCVWW